MGLSFSSLVQKQFGDYGMQVLMLGLDAAGKTTILYQLKKMEFQSLVPLIGFSIETLEYKKVKFTVWDLGGSDKIRTHWKNYYQKIQGLIFVVDSFDKDRIGCAKEELYMMMEEVELKDAVLLVFANKQDLQGAMNIVEITKILELHTLQRDWHIQGLCAQNRDGLQEGLGWLEKRVNKVL